MTKTILGLFLVVSSIEAQPNENNVRGPLEKMPVALEARLALSALPRSLRGEASLYVLDPPKGYVLERSGSNGQTCFVGRTEWKFAVYRNDVIDPICMMPSVPKITCACGSTWQSSKPKALSRTR